MRPIMLAGTCALLVGTIATVEAQESALPLTPLPPSGDIVAPFFDGWYKNPDGTYTLSFGFFNRNTEELIEIPIGPDNFIEPAEYDGLQPTSFPPVDYGGFSGRRERGAFAVRVPADFAGQEVVWTLRVNGRELSVPGKVTSSAYELGYTPMAAGSLPPWLSFSTDGERVSGREGVTIERATSVDQPLELRIGAGDRGEREEEVPVTVTWIKHQGPGTVEFEPGEITIGPPEGDAVATARFSEPGRYVLRARVDNFDMSDSSFADQCCWSNGFVVVEVSAP